MYMYVAYMHIQNTYIYNMISKGEISYKILVWNQALLLI